MQERFASDEIGARAHVPIACCLKNSSAVSHQEVGGCGTSQVALKQRETNHSVCVTLSRVRLQTSHDSESRPPGRIGVMRLPRSTSLRGASNRINPTVNQSDGAIMRVSVSALRRRPARPPSCVHCHHARCILLSDRVDTLRRATALTVLWRAGGTEPRIRPPPIYWRLVSAPSAAHRLQCAQPCLDLVHL